VPFQCDSKDKYMIFYLYGNAAFNLREYKLAESLYNKALQVNKSNLRPKPKTLTSLVGLICWFFNFKAFCFTNCILKGLRNWHFNEIQPTSMLLLWQKVSGGLFNCKYSKLTFHLNNFKAKH
jgi:tetratricopeptide (TPR) repeat protein